MRVVRLIQLLVTLQSGSYPNAQRLAEMCEVSRRTIYRDLATLEQAGVPIRYDEQRRGYFLGLSPQVSATSQLSEQEMLALVIMSRSVGGWQSFHLDETARAGVEKLLYCSEDRTRATLMALGELTGSRLPSIADWERRREVYENLLDSLAKRRVAQVHYFEPDDVRPVLTTCCPYRLLYAQQMWNVIGHSQSHNDVRLFRIPWIRRVELLDQTYEIPKDFSLPHFLGLAWGVERGSTRHLVRLVFSRRIAPAIAEVSWHPTQQLQELEDGQLTLSVIIDGLDEILGWILSFGDQVEVLEPVELRRRVHDAAANLTRLYRNQPANGLLHEPQPRASSNPDSAGSLTSAPLVLP